VSSVPPDVLKEKKLIALAVEFVAEKTRGVSLMHVNTVGASYPYSPDVPGVSVFGPDRDGRFTVNVHIAVAATRIPEVADRLRSEIWKEFKERDMADRIKSIDIYVEDLMMAV